MKGKCEHRGKHKRENWKCGFCRASDKRNFSSYLASEWKFNKICFNILRKHMERITLGILFELRAKVIGWNRNHHLHFSTHINFTLIWCWDWWRVGKIQLSCLEPLDFLHLTSLFFIFLCIYERNKIKFSQFQGEIHVFSTRVAISWKIISYSTWLDSELRGKKNGNKICFTSQFSFARAYFHTHMTLIKSSFY